jgi:hypothetical protein
LPSPLVQRLFAAAFTTLVLFGCAEERAPINRVQPNALEKAFFVGRIDTDQDDPEFYFRSTIVDVDFGATQMGLFTPLAAPVSRIHWEITEDLLLARLSFDRIDNSTATRDPGTAGVVVAAFPITSHFDIKRDYNPSTGESLNVVVENTNDSPWYARKYMRVNWSKNLVTTSYQFDAMASLYQQPPLEFEPVDYYVEDPRSADAPEFVPAEGYFDVTNKVYVEPQLVETPWGAYPACFFPPDFFHGSFPEGNCNPSELKLRMSFRKVTDTDYEAVDWDGARMNMFGALAYNMRFGYDRAYGTTDDQWHRFASRHNIWAGTHARGADGGYVTCYSAATTPPGADPLRDDDQNRTHDECEAVGNGSRCDPYAHKCTEPYRLRQTRTEAYYYSPGSDTYLFPEVSRALAEWDGALRVAVQASRYAECLRVGAGADSGKSINPSIIEECKAAFPTDLDSAKATVPPLAVLCHSPVASGDDPACGRTGLLARTGDIRYNMINVIADPQSSQPWGVEDDGVDPLSGEVLGASITVFDATTDKATQSAVDKMRWQLGETTNEQTASGGPLQAVNTTGQYRSWKIPVLDKGQIQRRVASIDRSLVGDKQAPPPMRSRDLLKWATDVTAQRFGDQALGQGNTPYTTRLALAESSGVENTLLTEPFYQMSGLTSSQPLDDRGLTLTSPLRGSFYAFRSELDRQREIALAERNRCELEAPEPNTTAAWARILDKKFPLPDADPESPGTQASTGDVILRNQRWADYLRRNFTFAVIAHEIGHSMGLAHVFTSSADTLNYRPQYWQLRSQDGAETTACTDAASDGASCIGPRWLDPVTETEDNGLIWRWMQTSVMEYPGELAQDTLGLGSYDRAFARFFYGDVVDVWDEDSVRCTANGAARSCSRGGNLLESRLDDFGGIVGVIWGDTTANPVHYSQLQNELGLVRNCRPADTSAPAGWDEAKDGVYVPEFDGNIVNGTVCETPPVDYVAYDELELDSPGRAPTLNVHTGDVRKYDAMGRVRRPYLYAGDDWADIGNVAVQRHDNGGDPYEIVHFYTSVYEDAHLFDNHRRGRATFGARPQVNRALSRYDMKLMEYAKGFALLNEVYSGAGVRDFILDAAGPGAPFEANALASAEVFDHLARILTRPHPGDHVQLPQVGDAGDKVLISTDTVPSIRGPGLASIPEGTLLFGNGDSSYGARPLNNALDDSKGYFATDYLSQVGAYYEKAYAAALLTDSFDRFVPADRDTFYDGRYRNIGLATLFPEGVRRLFANALTEDKSILGWRAAGTLTGAGGVNISTDPTTHVITQPMGQRSWWQTDPTVCWPRAGRIGCSNPADETYDGAPPPQASMALDPEVGFEVQKFVIFWSLLFLPENWKQNWVDMMRVWVIGSDVNPTFPNDQSIAWRDPVSGQLYVAHSYGREEIDGHSVQRGIAARAIEWANVLTKEAYEVESEDDLTGELTLATYTDDADCPEAVSSCQGQPIQKDAKLAIRTNNYKSVIDYLRDVSSAFGFGAPERKGIY